MVLERLTLKEGSHYFFPSSVVLKDFGKTKLKIAKGNCFDRTIYHIDYAKNKNDVNPLYLTISEFHGYIEKCNGRKYLIIAPIEMNNEVLKDYNKVWIEILEKINELSGSTYILDCYKIRVGSVKCEDEKYKIDLPFDKLLKFNLIEISSRLIIEKNDELFLETYLEDCLYKDE